MPHVEQHVGLVDVLAVVILQIEPVPGLKRAAGARAPGHVLPSFLRFEQEAGEPVAVVQRGVAARIGA